MLDEILEEKRAQVMLMQSMETIPMAENPEDIQECIYRAIEQEAPVLKEGGIYKLPMRYRLKNKIRQLVCLAFQMDAALQNFPLYKKGIRRVLVRIGRFRRGFYRVNLMKLMHMSDEKFVAEMYHIFLGSEPDLDGYQHNLLQLREHKVTRWFMFSVFCDNYKEQPIRLAWRRAARIIYYKK